MAGLLPTGEETDAPETPETPATPEAPATPDAPATPEAPTELLAGKFKTQDDLVKGYKELNKEYSRLRSGAPTEYKTPELPAPEDGSEAPTIDTDDPFYRWASAAAKGAGLSQEAFENMLVGHYDLQSKMADERYEASMKELGPDAEARINKLSGWLKQHLGTANYEKMRGEVQTPNQIAMLELLMDSGTVQAPSGTEPKAPAPVITEAMLIEARKDERYPHDVAYAQQLSKMHQQFYAQGGRVGAEAPGLEDSAG